jgi:WD40 repeat protein
VAKVFISYASVNLEYALDIHDYLVDAGHDVFLDRDARDGIDVGELWRERLYQELRNADAVVCLVTEAYLTSSWCAAEVGIADCLGCLLLPVRASAARVAHPLLPPQTVRYLDYHSARDEAKSLLRSRLRQVDAGGPGRWREGENPFPGLRSFTTDMASTFFGREAVSRQLLDQLRSPASADVGLTLVTGPSGCGKSSLLHAGVLPALWDDPRWLVASPVTPGADPASALANGLARTAQRVGLTWSVAAVRDTVAGADGVGGLIDELMLAAGRPPGARLIIPVDQGEELFSRAGEEARERFFGLLRPCLPGAARIVATLRSEFLDDVRAERALADVKIDTFLVGPLDRSMLRLVIEEPARRAGLAVEAELTARLVADTDLGTALPLLAFVLREIAAGLRRGDVVTSREYERLGGVAGALARHADATLTKAAATGVGREDILAGLVSLVTIDIGGRRTGRRVPRDDLPPALRATVEIFVDNRLLISGADELGDWVGVAHEALLHEWSALRLVLDEHAGALRTARELDRAAAEWHAARSAESYLWDDARLDTYLRTAAPDGSTTLTDVGRSFLTASRKRVADAARSERHRRRRVLAVLSALLVLALLATGAAISRQTTAVEASRSARSVQRLASARALLAQADAAVTRDPAGALRLGAAADVISPGAETDAGLVSTLTSTPYAGTLTGPRAAVEAVAFSPDGRTLAAGGDDATLMLWDLGKPGSRLGPPSASLQVHDVIRGIAFSPDGALLAAFTNHGAVEMWDLSHRRQPHQLASPPGVGGVNNIFFSADNTLGVVFSTRNAGALRFWDVGPGAGPRRVGSTIPCSLDVAYSPGARILAESLTDGTIELLDVSDVSRASARQIIMGYNGAETLALSRDGGLLAVDTGSGRVELWDLTDRQNIRKLSSTPSGQNYVYSLMFSPNNLYLAMTTDAYAPVLWDLGDPAHPQTATTLTGHDNAVGALAYSPDGQSIATGYTDGRILLWTFADRPHPVSTAGSGRTAVYGAVAESPTRAIMATGGTAGTRLWDVRAPGNPRALGNPLTAGVTTALAFSRDGLTLIAVTTDARSNSLIFRWNVSDPTEPRPVGGPLPAGLLMTAVAISPDGKTVAGGTVDNKTLVWDMPADRPMHRLGSPFTGHRGGMYVAFVAVAFTPDSRDLVTGGNDGTMVVWKMADRAHPTRLGTPFSVTPAQVMSLTFVDSRPPILVAGGGGVSLWDFADAARPRLLSSALGSNYEIGSVAVSADRKTIAAGTATGSTVLWDLTDRTRPRLLGQPLTHGHDDVAGVAFASDGQSLATATINGSVTLWDLHGLNDLRKHPLAAACRRGGGHLDPGIWAFYVPGTRYRDPCVASSGQGT